MRRTHVGLGDGLYSRGDTYYLRKKVAGKQVWTRLEARNVEEARAAIQTVSPEKATTVRGGSFREGYRPTVEQFIPRWLMYTQCTNENYRETLETRATKYLSYFKGIKVDEVKLKDLVSFREWLRIQRTEHLGRKKKLSEQTVKHILGHMRSLLFAAMKEGIIDSNPFDSNVLMPRIKQKLPDRLTDKELETIFKYVTPGAKAAILLGLHTGCRWGELKNLKWEQVNGDYIRLGETKSGKLRTVFLSAEAKETLSWIKETFPVGVWVLPLRPNTPWFPRLTLDACGFKWHYHQLRHTFACRWLEHGGSLEALQRLLGHSTPMMTQRYGALSDLAVGNEMKRVWG